MSTDEQIGIIATAAGISLAVGITDFIVMQVKQSRKKKALEKIREEQGTVIRIREGASQDADNIPNENQNGSSE